MSDRPQHAEGAPLPLQVLPAELAGNYGYVNACLWIAPGPSGAMPGARLLEPGRLTDLIAAYAAQFPGCDRRPVASMWLQIYVANLLPPLFAASFFRGLAFAACLDTTEILLGEDGSAGGFVLSTPGTAQGDAFDRFEPLLCDHIAPLIETLAREARVSRRLLWSNVAESFQAIAEVVEHMHGAPTEAAEAADLLLQARDFPDGRRNPLAGLTRYAPTDHEHHHRSRRVCCLRHMLTDFEMCPECPAPPERTR